jgi:hypothetical protein
MMSSSHFIPRSRAAHCILLAGAATLLLGGCANPWQEFHAGATQNALVAKLGPPKEVYTLPDGNKRLLWPTRPYGETTTAAVIDPSGTALSVEQALTDDNFYQAQVGVWTQHDVQIRFGLPEETAYFPLMKRAVWTYRYRENDYWYMLYHFYFDDNGVLRLTQKTTDPLHDPDTRGLL